MSGMTAVVVKGLWANKSRFGLSALAVTISVGFLTAMLILTNALAGTASDDIAAANAGVDAVVLGEELGSGFGPPGSAASVRAEISASTVDALLDLDGVDDAVGVRSITAQLLDPEGGLIEMPNQSTVVETWVSNPNLASFDLVQGVAPTSGIVIDELTADETGLAVGDDVRLLTGVGITEVTVEGIASYAGAESAPNTATILVSGSSDLLGAGGYERILIDTDLGVESLAVDGEVLTGAEYVEQRQDQVESQTSFRTTFLLAFALIALVAGTTIIYNTFVIAVAQRTRELALLRSIGASRAQVLVAVMAEAAVIGAVASAVGAVVGIGTAVGLVALFQALGIPIFTGSLVIASSSLVIGGGVGVAVTLLSAFLPARKAANTPPVAALRDATVDPSGLSRVRNRIAGLLLVVGSAAAVSGAVRFGWEAAVGGVLLAFVGIVVGGPMVSSWIARHGARPLEWIGGSVGRLAGTNAARNPRRSASTALALTLGVALIAFFTVVANSLSGTAASDTEAALRADQVVTPLAQFSGPAMPTSLPPSVGERIPVTNGIEAVVPVSTSTLIVEGETAFAAGVDVQELSEVYELDVTSGSFDDVGGTAAAVHADAAGEAVVGDQLTVTFPQTGEVQITIAAIYRNDLPGQIPARYVVDASALDTFAPGSGDALILIATDGSELSMATIDDALAASGGVLIQSAEEYIGSLGSAVDTFRNFVYALLGAAVVIAIVGIANTTVMAIGERTREIGMLRAVGMTTGQVRQMVRNEAMLLSTQGSIVGLALGVGGAYATFSALGDGEITLSLPAVSLVLIGVAAAFSGVLAAAWPAWRASRMAPLVAIAS